MREQVNKIVTLLHREFTVDLPLQKARQHLARVEPWPNWAKHIKHIALNPAGELGAKSTGVIHLSNGVKSAWTVTEFSPCSNWKWIAGFL